MNDKQHRTSLAVWDVVSPVVVSGTVTMKVGVKCSAGCELSGEVIEVRNESGETITQAPLGCDAWPGTNGLRWAEVQFAAPSTIGRHEWTVSATHDGAQLGFVCITVPPPECTLTIRVRDERTRAAIPNVSARIGVYQAESDEQGSARVELPKGNYSLTLWKIGYAHFSGDIHLSASQILDVALVAESQPAQPYWM